MADVMSQSNEKLNEVVWTRCVEDAASAYTATFNGFPVRYATTPPATTWGSAPGTAFLDPHWKNSGYYAGGTST